MRCRSITGRDRHASRACVFVLFSLNKFLQTSDFQLSPTQIWDRWYIKIQNSHSKNPTRLFFSSLCLLIRVNVRVGFSRAPPPPAAAAIPPPRKARSEKSISSLWLNKFLRTSKLSPTQVWGCWYIKNTHSKNLTRGYGRSSFWGAKTPSIK